jgi:miniconductance mechanosensitive channel
MMLDKFYDSFDHFFVDIYTNLGMSQEYAVEYANYSEFIIALSLSILFFYVVRFILRSFIVRTIKKTKNQWDDLILQHRVLHKASYLAPGIIMSMSVDHILQNVDWLLNLSHLFLDIYYAVVFAVIVNALLSVVSRVIITTTTAKSIAIKGVTQVLKIVVYIILAIVIVSYLMGKQPGTVLAGLGAASAIILLIFRDTILGFVGGIQLSAYDMVKEGDWISFPKHGADGTVLDISLTTVKVQNWDKTISTIPTYALVSESFKNWRGMEESGGRRIKRSINIDMNSVSFCKQEQLDKFKKIHALKDYIEKKEEELKQHNEKENIDNSVLVNGRRQTNLGVFRAYLIEYLRRKPEIHNEMTFLVRQLDPTEKGIPMEIYVFSKIQSWAEYEAIQSDIFDHIIASIPEFGLRVFQEPSGLDFKALVEK